MPLLFGQILLLLDQSQLGQPEHRRQIVGAGLQIERQHRRRLRKLARPHPHLARRHHRLHRAGVGAGQLGSHPAGILAAPQRQQRARFQRLRSHRRVAPLPALDPLQRTQRLASSQTGTGQIIQQARTWAVAKTQLLGHLDLLRRFPPALQIPQQLFPQFKGQPRQAGRRQLNLHSYLHTHHSSVPQIAPASADIVVLHSFTRVWHSSQPISIIHRIALKESTRNLCAENEHKGSNCECISSW